MNRILFSALIVLTSLGLQAQGVIGSWKTIDDGTGKAKSVVKIYEKQGKLYGDVIQLFNEDPNYDPVCKECKDELKGKKIIGMTIVNGLSKQKDYWYAKKGIIDPDNGKWYDVKIWREGNELKVRGYISFVYRTQTWKLHKP